MECYIPVSLLNDFVYSPESIYFHGVYQDFDTSLYHSTHQKEGLLNHSSIDQNTYSSRKDILQGVMFFCSKYQLCGRIDLFFTRTGELMERKSHINKIYPGYRYQLYAQMFGMKELGYDVNKLTLYAFDTNKKHSIPLPTQSDIDDFERVIEQLQNFDPLTILNTAPHSATTNISIYRELGF